MKLPRRRFLQLTARAAAFAVVPPIAHAQAYPIRPVRIVVGFAPGGVNDIGARLIGQWLSERLGQQFVIENRPGAGSNVATETVVNAPPDGYTLLLANSSNAINASLYEKLNFVFLRDITPAAAILKNALVLMVNPSVPATTVPEFIAYAKANGNRINMGTAGNGSINHLSGELFNMMAGLKIVQVHYRGAGPAMSDLLGGQIQVVFAGIPGAIDYINAGKLRALAVTTAERSDALPDVPPLNEFISGYESSNWIGLGAPKGTPQEVIDKINVEVNKGLVAPKLLARFVDLGGIALNGSPTDFGKLIAADTEKWSKAVRFSGARPE
jgi:tripartite-type tricarboxylate transporter receptor subunit TctC